MKPFVIKTYVVIVALLVVFAQGCFAEPAMVADFDVGTISIDMPDTVLVNTTLIPKAHVKNFGTLPTGFFNVRCIIDDPSVYNEARTITNLFPGDSTRVMFREFTFEKECHKVIIYTQLIGDQRPDNDTLEKTIWTKIIDVAALSIDIDPILPENTSLTPKAHVINKGTNSETFSVTCEINPGAYCSTDTVIGLEPDEEMQIAFANEFTFLSGTYTVTVYTHLADDQKPGNDTIQKLIETYPPGIIEGNMSPTEPAILSVPSICKDKVEIVFTLAKATKVEFLIYDAVGRLAKPLVSQWFTAGRHSISVNLDLPAGVYFCSLKTGISKSSIKKLLISE